MTAGLPPHGGRVNVAPVAVAERSATAGAEIVGVSGLQARPLRNGTPVIPHSLLALARLRPTRLRVLPRLLPPVDREIEQSIAVVHRLHAAPRRPVGLEDLRSFAQV